MTATSIIFNSLLAKALIFLKPLQNFLFLARNFLSSLLVASFSFFYYTALWAEFDSHFFAKADKVFLKIEVEQHGFIYGSFFYRFFVVVSKAA